MEKINILIVDDHTLIAQTCALTLKTLGLAEIALTTNSPEKAIELVQEQYPDIVLLDIKLREGSGYDLIKPILQCSPSTKIIGYSAHTQSIYAKRMIQLGAKGYVSKDSSIAELTEAITRVMQGENYICLEIRESFIDEILSDKKTGQGISSLTERELEILKYVQQGMYSKDIADLIGISLKTVEAHRHNILKKLKAKNSASAIAHYNSYIS